MKVIPETRRMH